MTERMKKQNTDLQDTMKKGWDGYEQRIGKAKILSLVLFKKLKHIEGLKEKLKDLGLSQKEIAAAKANYDNYATNGWIYI